MPRIRVNKFTGKLLELKRLNTGLSNPEIIEFAVLNMPMIDVSKRRGKHL